MVRRPPVSRAAVRGAIAVLITTMVLSTSPAPVSAVPTPVNDGATRASRSPVVVIVLENHEYGSIIDQRRAPYLKRFARRGTLFTHFHALHHPSLPNYLEMTSGQSSGCRSDDCAKARFRANNLFAQLGYHGIRWTVWAESMGSRCRTSSHGLYASWHNPALYYRNLMPKVCARRDVPYPKHLPRYMPRFVFAVPNLCHDMHDCSIARGSRWLRHHVPPLLHHGATVIITFDEGLSSVGGGGHIYTAMRGPGVPHRRDAHTYSHRGLLAGLERHFGLRRIYGARHARALPIP